MLVFQTYIKSFDKQLLSQKTRKHPGNRSPLKYKTSYEKTSVIVAIIITVSFQIISEKLVYSYAS